MNIFNDKNIGSMAMDTTRKFKNETQNFAEISIFDYYNMINGQTNNSYPDIEMSGFVNSAIVRSNNKFAFHNNLKPSYLPFGDSLSLEDLPEEEKLLSFYGPIQIFMSLVLGCTIQIIAEREEDQTMYQIGKVLIEESVLGLASLNPDSGEMEENFVQPEYEDMQTIMESAGV